ncbi:hypothetical protein K8I61_11180 [bacterium]|nr:hypothetical protein [bacterium]
MWIALAIGGLFVALAAVAFAESMRGQLYLVTKQATLSYRAGAPCLPGKEGDGVEEFCDRNHLCPDGQVANSLIAHVDTQDGKTALMGLGLACRDPNEIYSNERVGMNVTSETGRTYVDSCDTGFFLAGAEAYTEDRQNVTGIRAICRRYWPVETNASANIYGEGTQSEAITCGEGQFAIGLKTSHIVPAPEDKSRLAEAMAAADEPTAEPAPPALEHPVFRNFRFFCAEMRHWIGNPEDVRDPRDPKTRK